MIMSDLGLQLRGARLVTAEILYHMPDHPEFLQTFVWQTLDQLPKLPQLRKFLDFWVREIDGPLHSVKVATAELVKPAELHYRNGELVLH
ncbi:MAG: Usg family protein [Alphaproteobacteria bacterium]|jgi:uncharacterized protein Usg|nr:Usg family protein [Alphaproteobacteria bacterium]